MGLIGYWGSLVFYNSYLPDIAFREQQDRISAKGFCLGYIGSVLLLVLNFAMVMKTDFFFIEDYTGTNGLAIETAAKVHALFFITVGLWWILFSQYTFYVFQKEFLKGIK